MVVREQMDARDPNRHLLRFRVFNKDVTDAREIIPTWPCLAYSGGSRRADHCLIKRSLARIVTRLIYVWGD
ncbi:hypothetical protein NYO67_4585 [Aspergillus flavus]|nr:hypothetical protein NYO67_4585 [Aspergillus flavus]